MRINDNGVDRDMTKAEETAHVAAIAVIQADIDTSVQVRADKDTKRQAVLAKLKITADEFESLFR